MLQKLQNLGILNSQQGKIHTFLIFQKAKVIQLLRRQGLLAQDKAFIGKFLMMLPSLEININHLKQKDYMKLIDTVKYVKYDKGKIIFKQNDQANSFFVILTGSIEIYEEIESLQGQKIDKVINTLGPMTTIGCRSFFNFTKFRNTSARAASTVQLIQVGNSLFQQTLFKIVFKQREEIITFFDSIIPSSRNLRNPLKEKMMVLFHVEEYFKNQNIILQGQPNETLFFIINGECNLNSDEECPYRNFSKMIFSLGSGSFFGEESVLSDQSSQYTVKVASESCRCLCIEKENIQKLPNAVLQDLKQQISLRTNLRNQLKVKKTQIFLGQQQDLPSQNLIQAKSYQISPKILSQNAKKTIEVLLLKQTYQHQKHRKLKLLSDRFANVRNESIENQISQRIKGKRTYEIQPKSTKLQNFQTLSSTDQSTLDLLARSFTPKATTAWSNVFRDNSEQEDSQNVQTINRLHLRKLEIKSNNIFQTNFNKVVRKLA